MRALQLYKFLIALCVAVLAAGACSFPNMDDPECAAPRTVVRELYSYHFGSDMKLSPEAYEQRKKFLTPEFFAAIATTPPDRDPFTQTTAADVPRAFSIGLCTVNGDEADINVRMLWKNDNASRQQDLDVRAVRRGDEWLVNSISKK